jgi:hypothetical protein
LLHYPNDPCIRRNLQRHIKGLVPLTEDEFESTLSAADHISASSSISGSDSDGASSNDDIDCKEEKFTEKSASSQHSFSHTIVRHPVSHALFLCWSAVFDIGDGVASHHQPAFWSQPTAMILCSGGHFAATLFERNRVLKSKTFHRYVVRAKQVPFYHSIATVLCILNRF